MGPAQLGEVWPFWRPGRANNFVTENDFFGSKSKDSKIFILLSKNKEDKPLLGRLRALPFSIFFSTPAWMGKGAGRPELAPLYGERVPNMIAFRMHGASSKALLTEVADSLIGTSPEGVASSPYQQHTSR
jgi:hypothetical protein